MYITKHRFLGFGFCQFGIIKSILLGYISLNWFNDK
jgi:hypothetical protein